MRENNQIKPGNSNSEFPYNYEVGERIEKMIILESNMNPLEWTKKYANTFRKMLDNDPEIQTLINIDPEEAKILIKRRLDRQ